MARLTQYDPSPTVGTRFTTSLGYKVRGEWFALTESEKGNRMTTATVTAWRVVMATDGGAIRILPVKTQEQGEECAESVIGTETARGVIAWASVERSDGGDWDIHRAIVHYTEY